MLPTLLRFELITNFASAQHATDELNFHAPFSYKFAVPVSATVFVAVCAVRK